MLQYCYKQRNHMDKPFVRIVSVFVALFVAMVALMAVLRIFNVVDTEMLKSSTIKIAAVVGVLTAATAVITGIQGLTKK